MSDTAKDNKASEWPSDSKVMFGETATITVVARVTVEVTARSYIEAFEEITRAIRCDHPGIKSITYT